jgi:hypothetical protein
MTTNRLTETDLDRHEAERLRSHVLGAHGAMNPKRAIVIPTRRTRWHRIKRTCAIWWLRYEIHDAEEWIKNCERDGVTGPKQMQAQRRRVEALRVRLSLWEAS